MYFRLLGKYHLRGTRIHVSSVNRRPFAYVGGKLAQALRAKDNPLFAEFSIPGNPKSVLSYTKAQEIDKILVFWDASHPRQKVRMSLCRSFQGVAFANFGASVIGLMDPGGCLVFRYRNITERVFYDPETDDLVERITHEH